MEQPISSLARARSLRKGEVRPQDGIFEAKRSLWRFEMRPVRAYLTLMHALYTICKFLNDTGISRVDPPINRL